MSRSDIKNSYQPQVYLFSPMFIIIIIIVIIIIIIIIIVSSHGFLGRPPRSFNGIR